MSERSCDYCGDPIEEAPIVRGSRTYCCDACAFEGSRSADCGGRTDSVMPHSSAEAVERQSDAFAAALTPPRVTPSPTPSSTFSAQGKRVAVLAENLYQELELWYPLLRMREAGAEVKVIGSGSADTYKSKLGYAVKVDASADEVSADDFDAVIIPGGYAPDLMRRYPALVNFVRDMNDQGKIIAAICHAAWVPISAGILQGRRATCYFSIKDDLVNAGATYVDESVVRDGNLITSRVPDDLPVFCHTILEALAP